jgi:hypothetical protein
VKKKLGSCLVLLALVVGCRGQVTLSKATETTIVAANAAYGLSVEACDIREKQIIDRQNTSEAQDQADMARVRATCDHIFRAFETVRTAVPYVKQLEDMKL